jgi:phosphoglycolate phosphatase-like HAD superfamily hydrolase
VSAGAQASPQIEVGPGSRHILHVPTEPVAVILDFDGVVVESVELKVQAFLTMYAHESPEKQQAILEHQRAHGGVTRRLKFAHFERELFGRPGDTATLDRLAAGYAKLVHGAVLACPFIRGAIDFLDTAHGRTDLHVVSGTPEEELLDIIERRGLARYFKSIHGAPKTKPEAFRLILDVHRYPHDEVIAVGDATTEYDAAVALQMPFIGIVADPGDNPFPPEVPVLATLERLASRMGFAKGP